VGTYIAAVGGNESASIYSGINANLVKLSVYVASALCAGIAGLLLAGDNAAADANNLGLNYELDAILSVVIGGTLFTGGRFNLAGSVIGALVMRTLTISIEMNGVNPAYTLVVEAIIVVLVCAAQSASVRESLGRLVHRRSAG
jgi:galactofuranose transport system permease protein